MNLVQTALWEKLQRFQFNEPGIDFSFEQRLARENGWTTHYTQRVIEEYKKFIFLCCISEPGITPSDPVDQAWHLHLTFTKSYWIDLCKNTLGKEIHHNPTKGGQAEAKKFNNYYSILFEKYQQTFNAHPPADIWHPHQKRFSDIDFQRVNLGQYWLVKKPSYWVKRMLLLAGIGLFALLFIQAISAAGIIVAIVGTGLIFWLSGLKPKKKRRKGNNNNDGCSSVGAGCVGSGPGHHGHSGCGSGCSGDSGCSGGSGCSGCGGGGD